MESSSIEIEVFARRCFFSYKVIKKTENNQSLGDLLENSNARESKGIPTSCTRLTDPDSGWTRVAWEW